MILTQLYEKTGNKQADDMNVKHTKIDAKEIADATSNPIVRFYFEVYALKSLYRQGWLRQGVPREKAESVADHSFGTALLGFLIAEQYFPELDSSKVMRMGLMHELGEIYVGDITPHDHVLLEEKHKLEKDGVVRVLSWLPRGKEYVKLWEEYEARETPEAKFVKQIDKLETALQAEVYRYLGYEGLEEFFGDSTRKQITDPKLIEILDELEKLT